MSSRWYIIHAYSGFENKVRDAIMAEATRMGLDRLVEQVEVPTEKVTEVRRGKKVQSERKFFPGYVLAKLDMNDDVYHLVKNTPKVTGFLGAAKPQPITEAARAGITLSACAPWAIEAVGAAARETGVTVRTHIKVDTGLGRGGSWGDDLDAVLPHVDAVMMQPGHQHGGREQQQLLPGDGVEVDRLFLELQSRQATEQPAAQRPGRIVLAADRQRGAGHGVP